MIIRDYQKLTNKQKETYVFTLLKKCWRSTRARVERTMMVVHIAPRVHHPAAGEAAGSTWAQHVFIPLLCWPRLISDKGGLANPRLEKMTWSSAEAQHCPTHTVMCLCLLCTNQIFTAYAVNIVLYLTSFKSEGCLVAFNNTFSIQKYSKIHFQIIARAIWCF